MIKVSVIIPVKNGEATLRKCLDAIFKQTVIDSTEVIVIDSGSTDGTLDILKQYPVRLYQIAPEDFNHGNTRNYGVSLAKGEFVVMTVQDAIVTEDIWLEKFLQHFEDPEIVAVSGQQFVPHHESVNPHLWFRPVSQARVQKVKFDDPKIFSTLTAIERRNYSSVDNVISCYRKVQLINRPFPMTEYGEDMLWAQSILREGKAILYDMNIRVEHYHHHTFNYTYKHSVTDLYFNYKHFDIVPEVKLSPSSFLLIVYRNIKYRVSFYWIWHNCSLIIVRWYANKRINNALKRGEIDAFYKKEVKMIPIGKSRKKVY